jgi:hypothetical protein
MSFSAASPSLATFSSLSTLFLSESFRYYSSSSSGNSSTSFNFLALFDAERSSGYPFYRCF